MTILNVLSVLAHLALATWIVVRSREYTVLLGYVVFVQSWSVLSCFYNDLGIYNIELFGYTHNTLATTRLALFYIVFNLGFFFVISFLARRPLLQRDYNLGLQSLRLGNLKLAAYGLGLLIVTYIAYSFVTGGVPLFEGIHKVLFYQEAGPLERFLLGYGPFIAFALGYFRRIGGRISVNGILFVFMLAYLVLTGNKFSALLRLAIGYYAAVFVQYLRAHPDVRILRHRNALIGLSLAALLLAGAFASYSLTGLNAIESRQLLFDRVLALQGHLWWATDHNLFGLDRFDSNHWQTELGAILNVGNVAEGSVGMKYVMVQAIGAEKAFPIFDSGYLYTMAYPAILVLTLPYPLALLVQLAAGAFLGILLYYLHYSLKYRHFVRSFIAMTIILPYLGVLSTGDLWVFLTPGIAVKILILIVMEFGLVEYAPSAQPKTVLGSESTSG
jgi:hypothetical protein